MNSLYAARGRIPGELVKLQPEPRRQTFRENPLSKFARTESKPGPRGVWEHRGEYHFADLFGISIRR
jgi:hypothetical protein